MTTSRTPTQRWAYPPARNVDFHETVHGHVLADPFHWLEGAETGEVATWMKAEQALTDSYIRENSDENSIRKWLTEFLDKPFVFHAFDAGLYRFLLRESPGMEQPVLLRATQDDIRVVVDPNAEEVEGRPAILDQESIAAAARMQILCRRDPAGGPLSSPPTFDPANTRPQDGSNRPSAWF